ncbi:MAG: hypothetical protein J6A26_07250 [Oscillospiraceae bacterium]|nr:hypothetical protein [Oscillospiraceae bacterium]
MATKRAAPAAEAKFQKEALLKSERFRDQRDLISAVLDDDRCYSIREAEEKIQSYMKGKVK